MATTPTTSTATVTPTISNANVTTVAGSAGAPFSVATITTSTVTNPTTGYSANVESVLFQLTPTASSTYGGAIQADYVVGSNGVLSVVDQVFYQANGALTATYYGSENLNPFFLATGATPADPGYAYTQYSYNASGAITQVVAAETNGTIYVGPNTSTIS